MSLRTRAPTVRKIQVFLKALSARTGARQSDLVRQGVDLLLERATRESADWREATRAVAGLWRDRADIEGAAGELRRSLKKRFRRFTIATDAA